MGIPITVVIYIYMAAVNVWCSRLITDVNDYTKRNVGIVVKHKPQPSRFPYKRIGNDYAVIMYHVPLSRLVAPRFWVPMDTTSFYSFT